MDYAGCPNNNSSPQQLAKRLGFGHIIPHRIRFCRSYSHWNCIITDTPPNIETKVQQSQQPPFAVVVGLLCDSCPEFWLVALKNPFLEFLPVPKFLLSSVTPNRSYARRLRLTLRAVVADCGRGSTTTNQTTENPLKGVHLMHTKLRPVDDESKEVAEGRECSATTTTI